MIEKLNNESFQVTSCKNKNKPKASSSNSTAPRPNKPKVNIDSFASGFSKCSVNKN